MSPFGSGFVLLTRMNCERCSASPCGDEPDGSDGELGEVGVTDRGAALLAVDEPCRLLVVGKRLVDRDDEFARP